MKNKLKFHTTTNLPNYGCDLYPMEKLPKFGRKFIQRKKKKIILVKQRKQGLTGSGIHKMCHSNVSLLVRQFGGTQLSGYVVILPGDMVVFLYHSVWVTPEGMAVNVSPLLSITGKYVPFIPLQSNSWFKENTPIFSDFLITPSKKRTLMDKENCGAYQEMPSTMSISIHKSKKYDLSEWGNMSMTYPDDGGFTKPSLLTGKTWDEIQQSEKEVTMK